MNCGGDEEHGDMQRAGRCEKSVRSSDLVRPRACDPEGFGTKKSVVFERGNNGADHKPLCGVRFDFYLFL